MQSKFWRKVRPRSVRPRFQGLWDPEEDLVAYRDRMQRWAADNDLRRSPYGGCCLEWLRTGRSHGMHDMQPSPKLLDHQSGWVRGRHGVRVVVTEPYATKEMLQSQIDELRSEGFRVEVEAGWWHPRTIRIEIWRE